ncbi:MAG: metal ABC transporter substrate-binding protein [Eubacteriales bacterium]|nr:metal ABC transporter substrate-binding protein [Eubacteriales bacterium]
MKMKPARGALALALALGLILALALPGLAAQDKSLRVVATVFPVYDWLRNILGDTASPVSLSLLQDSGRDLHNFQPSAQDIMRVSSADVFVYVGGQSEQWVENAVAEAVNPGIVAINLMAQLGGAVKAEEMIEGMQDAPHAHSDEDRKDHIDARGDDEHIWLSLRNAAALTQMLAGCLGGLDPANAAAYQANAEVYIGKLAALDGEFQSAVDQAPVKTLLFADRFPFRYLMDDYGLEYYAAFPGCSAESEASFETVTFLARKADELGLKNVLVLEGGDKDLARTIVSSTREAGQDILAMDSMQSVNRQAIEAGASYLGLMESNLRALEEALQ